MGVCFTACENGRRRKKRGGEEVSIDPIVLNSLTQLWLLNVVKKDRGAQNFRVLESYYVVLLLTADCYYEPNPPDNQQNFPSHSSKSSHEQRVPYPSARHCTVQYTN